MAEFTEETPPEPENPYDASDPVQVESRKRKSKRKENRVDNYTKQLMSSPDGRAWMFSLLEMAHLYSESQTERDEGERRLGLKILARINRACPDMFIQMMADRLKED
jgi:hypothetical protein